MKKYFVFICLLFFVVSCKKSELKYLHSYKVSWKSAIVTYNFPLFYLDTFIVESHAEAYHIFKITSTANDTIIRRDFKKILAKYNNKFIPISMDAINQDENKYLLSVSTVDSLFVKGRTNQAFQIKSNVRTIEDKIFKHYDSIVKNLEFVMVMNNGDSLPVEKSRNFEIKMVHKLPE